VRALLCVLVLAACDDTVGTTSPTSTACGTGPATLELGEGLPFTPVPDGRLPIHRGTQGGFHLLVSMRARGAMDPDHADVRFDLSDGHRVVATWKQDDALLDTTAGGCDYDKAQLVFQDENGRLLPEDRVTALAGPPLTLDLTMTSALGSAHTRRTVTLDPPPSEPPTR
jgi:hypothetical protein